MNFAIDALGAEEDGGEGSRFPRKKIIIPVLVVAIVVIAGYYEITSYEQGVVNTSVMTGKIVIVQLPAPGPGLGAAEAMKNPGAIGVAQAGGGNFGHAYVVISTGSGNITQTLQCDPVPYQVGQTVMVADQLLRNGQHHYAPDVACGGGISPFESLHITQTTVSSST